MTIPGWSNHRTSRQKWLYDQADWSLYERVTAETIRSDVEWDVDSFTEKIIAAAKKAIPRSSGRIGPKSVPWWYPEVKAAIRRRRKCLRSLRRLQRSNPSQPDALASFQEAKAEAKKAVNQAKQQSWEDFVAKISPSSTTTELWRLRGNRQQRPVVLKKVNGFTDNPEEAAEELA